MPTFQYTAQTTDNDAVSGTLEAETESAALAELTQRGLHSLQITLQESSDPQPEVDGNSSRAAVVFDEDLSASLEHITGAGLPLESGLRLLAESHPSPRVSRNLLQLSNRLARGESWEQISQGKHAELPPVYQELFQLPLAPGQLSDVLNRYLYYTGQANETRRKIWGGLFYSFVILAALAVVSGYFLVSMIPEFKELFNGFDTELPPATMLLIEISDLVVAFGWWIPVTIVSAIVLLCLFGGRYIQSLWYNIPYSGRAFEGASLSAFCHLLAEFVEKKAPVGTALRLAARGSRNLTLKQECETIAQQVDQGVPLGEALLHSRSVPAEVVHAFRWSSQPAEFVDSLHASGSAFQGQARTRAGLIPVVSEPFLMFLILAVALTFAGVVFLPMIKLLNDLS